MPFLQDIIYKLEVGAGARYLRAGLMALLLLGLVMGYNVCSYKNMYAPEAMDAAQVARNLAEGKGFSTLFIRPLSIYLVKKSAATGDKDPARLKGMHPDLANPPVYPLVLAALMKVLPFHHPVDITSPFWSNAGHFWRYEPDFLIGLFNQFLFLIVIALTFFLARHLFDSTIAWMSAVLLAGTELLWRFSVSGLSTMLLMVIFMALLWCVALLEQSAREGRWGRAGLFGLTVLAGLLIGIGGLTRYAFGWLIIPVLVFLMLFGGRQRFILAVVALAAFLAVMTPWITRNVRVCGLPFGISTFAVMEGTPAFNEYRLERSLEPKIEGFDAGTLIYKFLGNARRIVEADLPKIGGSWVTAYFLAGLLVAFRSFTISRLRYFLLLCLVTLIAAQALGRTQLSEETPEVNSENLLILLFPLVLILGVCLFFLLLEQVRLPDPRLRLPAIGAFGLIACIPMLFTFVPPRTSPVAYPPYHPQIIQDICRWMKQDELMMSDIPWAMAWYGKRQCICLTLNSREDFFAVSDELKPVKALYLTTKTLDSRFVTEWMRTRELSWGSFAIAYLVHREVPPYFPLHHAIAYYSEGQLFLTDWERWKK